MPEGSAAKSRFKPAQRLEGPEAPASNLCSLCAACARDEGTKDAAGLGCKVHSLHAWHTQAFVASLHNHACTPTGTFSSGDVQ